MYLTHTDYSNNEYSLLKALKRQQKGTTYRYIDVEAKRKNDRITDIYIHYNYASTEYSCWRTSVYIVEIDECGKSNQEYSKNALTELWAEHIKQIKQFRADRIKQELITKTVS